MKKIVLNVIILWFHVSMARNKKPFVTCLAGWSLLTRPEPSLFIGSSEVNWSPSPKPLFGEETHIKLI